MSRPFRIMHVLSGFRAGGAETNTVRLVAGLARRGWQQVVVALSREVDAALGEELDAPLWLPPKTGRLPGTLSYLARSMRQFEPSIVHGRAFRTWIDCAAARLISGGTSRLVQSFHGPDSFQINRRRRRVAAWCLDRGTTAYVAVSRDLACRLNGQWHIPSHKVRVIPNGVDVTRFRAGADPAVAKGELGLDPACCVIGTVGSLRAIKNHTLLLRAFSAVLRERHDVRLLIVGQGPMHGELQCLARELGIGPRVDFCGHHPDVRKHLAATDIFVQPSLHEGSPTALLEALACGLPAVAVNCPGCSEINARCGVPFLVDGHDPVPLAAALIDLVTSPQRRAALGRQGVCAVTRFFGFDAMLQAYDQLYRTLLEPVVRTAREVPA